MTFKKIIMGDSGFTLMELMVVIAIAGIVSAISIPNLLPMRTDSKLNGAVRELVANIQKTKMSSIKNNEDWAIQFNPGSYDILSAWDDATVSGNIKKTISFTDYKSGVGYGKGLATKEILGGNFVGNASDFIGYSTLTPVTNNILIFNSNGTCNGEYVYLSNSKGTVYGVGTMVSGIVILKKWSGPDWED